MDTHARMKVGIAQIDSKLGDLQHNLQIHLQQVSKAREAGVELLLFPELSLTGYSLGALVPEVAMARNAPMVMALAEAAGDMTVVFGMVEEGPAAQFYNASVVVRRGRVLHLHRKLNLPTYGQLEEGKLFAQGQHVDTVVLQAPWTAGLLICADLWNPALVHLAMQQNATLLLAPVNSALDAVSEEFSNPAGWDLAVRFYAMTYGVPVLMANRVGTEGGTRFWGGSRIVGPKGDVLAQCPDDSSCLLTAELEYGVVRQARFTLPTLRDANLPLVQREINRLAALPQAPDLAERTE